jgi:hypothetical protein
MIYVVAAIFTVFVVVIFGAILNPPTKWLHKLSGEDVEPNETLDAEPRARTK